MPKIMTTYLKGIHDVYIYGFLQRNAYANQIRYCVLVINGHDLVAIIAIRYCVSKELLVHFVLEVHGGLYRGRCRYLLVALAAVKMDKFANALKIDRSMFVCVFKKTLRKRQGYVELAIHMDS